MTMMMMLLLPPPAIASFSVLFTLCIFSFFLAAPSLSISSKRVHIFYYLWYGNPEVDGKYQHWDHEVLPHWEARISTLYPSIGKRHSPPGEIHSPYYPMRGLYSSADELVIEAHISELISSGVDVMVVSWWGRPDRGFSDTQGINTDKLIEKILFCADKRIGSGKEISVAFHLEPYASRSIDSIREDLSYIHSKYGHHRSIYREYNKIVFYVYDSYHINPADWSRLLTIDGELSVRGSELDGFFYGLWLDHNHGHDLSIGGFDGIYSYFASSSVSYGSNPDNWRHMCSYCKKKNMVCSLSVGPGYIDTGIRPWNFHSTKERSNGRYYQASWSYAIRSKADVISITSYNEWGEGTQIEPAMIDPSVRYKEKKYHTYGQQVGDQYMYTNMTLLLAEEFKDKVLGTSGVKSIPPLPKAEL